AVGHLVAGDPGAEPPHDDLPAADGKMMLEVDVHRVAALLEEVQGPAVAAVVIDLELQVRARGKLALPAPQEVAAVEVGIVRPYQLAVAAPIDVPLQREGTGARVVAVHAESALRAPQRIVSAAALRELQGVVVVVLAVGAIEGALPKLAAPAHAPQVRHIA